jgi:DNA-binding NtrC family response regulator
VQLPPLRERRDDIPILAQHFLDKFCAHTRQPVTISQEAMRRLMNFLWPGNVRQLENAIERAVAFGVARGLIDVDDLPSEVGGESLEPLPSAVTLPENGLDLDSVIDRIEHELIQRALERTGGNRGQAARLLNLKRTTLVEKLKRMHA